LARLVIINHLVFGAIAAGVMIFHERFTAALVTAVWYVFSIGLIVGVCHMLQWCRVMLAIWFMIGALVAFAYLAWLPPPPTDSTLPPPPLSVKLMPFWLSTLALGYLMGAVSLLLSSRIYRATQRGFALWEVPNNW
jgi:hypothetical protein